MSTKPSQLTLQWFVIYTHARSERRVHAKLVASGINSFLPLRIIKRRTARGFQLLEVPLFSNYLFVQTTAHRVARLPAIPGMARLVRFGGKPASVSNQEIEDIRLSCDRAFRGKVGNQIVVVRGNASHAVTEQPTAHHAPVPIQVDANQAQVA